MSASNLEQHAEREMRAAGLYDKDADYGGMMPESVMALIRAHSGQGHSGFSSRTAIDLFSRLAQFKTLTPLTADPEEWMLVADSPEPLFQSRRQSSCFSSDGGESYYDIDSPEGKTKVHKSEPKR